MATTGKRDEDIEIDNMTETKTEEEIDREREIMNNERER